ncbi:hypothetical protein J4216_04925 [Candidatus Woesearchaeota archaeon]|nr:hypothetical protein [Candidatus Woesearchaeota archaeon]
MDLEKNNNPNNNNSPKKTTQQNQENNNESQNSNSQKQNQNPKIGISKVTNDNEKNDDEDEFNETAIILLDKNAKFTRKELCPQFVKKGVHGVKATNVILEQGNNQRWIITFKNAEDCNKMRKIIQENEIKIKVENEEIKCEFKTLLKKRVSRRQIFIRGIPIQWDQEMLEQAFLEFSECSDAEIYMDPDSDYTVSSGRGKIAIHNFEVAEGLINTTANREPAHGFPRRMRFYPFVPRSLREVNSRRDRSLSRNGRRNDSRSRSRKPKKLTEAARTYAEAATNKNPQPAIQPQTQQQKNYDNQNKTPPQPVLQPQSEKQSQLQTQPQPQKKKKQNQKRKEKRDAVNDSMKKINGINKLKDIVIAAARRIKEIDPNKDLELFWSGFLKKETKENYNEFLKVKVNAAKSAQEIKRLLEEKEKEKKSQQDQQSQAVPTQPEKTTNNNNDSPPVSTPATKKRLQSARSPQTLEYDDSDEEEVEVVEQEVDEELNKNKNNGKGKEKISNQETEVIKDKEINLIIKKVDEETNETKLAWEQTPILSEVSTIDSEKDNIMSEYLTEFKCKFKNIDKPGFNHRVGTIKVERNAIKYFTESNRTTIIIKTEDITELKISDTIKIMFNNVATSGSIEKMNGIELKPETLGTSLINQPQIIRMILAIFISNKKIEGKPRFKNSSLKQLDTNNFTEKIGRILARTPTPVVSKKNNNSSKPTTNANLRQSVIVVKKNGAETSTSSTSTSNNK